MACLQTINDSTFSQFFSSSGFFLVHFFHRPGNNCLFFQSDFFSARLGIALEVGRQKKKLIQCREAFLLLYTKKCAVSEPQKEYLIKKNSQKPKPIKYRRKKRKTFTLFENYTKCRIWILACSTNICSFNNNLSGNTAWPKASGFGNYPMSHLNFGISTKFCPLKRNLSECLVTLFDKLQVLKIT